MKKIVDCHTLFGIVLFGLNYLSKLSECILEKRSLFCVVLLVTNIISAHCQTNIPEQNVTLLANVNVTTVIDGVLYLSRSLNKNEAIKIVADGFTGDPDNPAISYSVFFYGYPSPRYPNQNRYVMYLQIWNGMVKIGSNYKSVYHNDYFSTRDMYMSTNPDDPIRLEFKLTSSKWEIYYQGSRIPEYDWPYVTTGNISKIVTQFLVNPVISVENTAGIDFSVDINSAEFIVATLLFIIISLIANAAIIYFFYWKHRNDSNETLEAAAWDPYLQQLVVPLSLLIEDLLALSFEDPGKSMNINVTTVVIIQFVCLMVISWCRECLSFSIPTKRIGSILAIAMEYTFGIVFISLSRSPALAGFIIGTLTMIQIIAEIISIIFVKHTDSCFCIPSLCRLYAPQSLDTDLSNQERVQAMAMACCQEGGSRTMILVIVFHVIFFAAGCVYVENGECYNYGDWFKYWWVFGMFLFSKIMESKFDSTYAEKWEKKLIMVYLAALELFIVISTFYAWGFDYESDKEECKNNMPFFLYAGMVMIVWIILIGGVVVYYRLIKPCLG